MSDPTPLRYDREAIQRHLDRLTEWESAWRDWFAAQDITPLSVCYEDLASDLHRTVGDVLAHIGQDPRCAQNLAPHVQPLSDQTNRHWVSRYRSDLASGP